MIEVIAPAFRVERHQTQLFNITDGVQELVGTSEYSISASGVYDSNKSFIRKVITITSQKTFDIQYRCSDDQVLNGFEQGSPLFAGEEVYTVIKITKIAN
ncbi:hypothetical protein OAQ99_03900 [Candidatus Kapabacteria bacterium]|nr:hypothetical protein [Candidatus Kapabacteria bacterium]